MTQSAVVFAYHNVGLRGLAALLASGIKVSLLVTHEDNPEENIWFGSVAELANLHGIPVIKPDDPNTSEVIRQIEACKPDWLFSFYYRHMLCDEFLQIPPRGAYNMHGSLLPKYRGRVPVNWAIIHGEQETGASLHRMEIKPDAGALIDQQVVPILPNDTALDVFHKISCAAEQVLVRSLPQMIAGTQAETALDLSAGSYFGGRRPEQGRIDWNAPAQQIHNLVRALAPPYPPAFFDIDGHRVYLHGSFFRGDRAQSERIRIYWSNDHCYADCADGYRLLITELVLDQQSIDQSAFAARFGSDLLLSNLEINN